MKPIIVATERAVFFGLVPNDQDMHAESITLENARHCLYWPESVGGWLGLADIGPQDGSRITATAPSATIRNVTGTAECTNEAAENWKTFDVVGR